MRTTHNPGGWNGVVRRVNVRGEGYILWIINLGLIRFWLGVVVLFVLAAVILPHVIDLLGKGW
jgi:hypothetical protein